VNNVIVDGSKSVKITATADGFASVDANFTVTDDDVAALGLSFVQSSIEEKGGSTLATVTRNTDTTASLVVNLTSSMPTSISLLPTVTILPGAASVTFNISAKDDKVATGDMAIDIQATATGFTSATKVLTIVDAGVTTPTLDYGNARSPYPVTLAQDGARHTVGSLFLGGSVDAELDGVANSTTEAGGDGIKLMSSLIASTVVTTSSVQVQSSAAGKLDAWIDFNRDGDWLDADEQVFASASVVAGSNLLSFIVPANAANGSTAARFRLSTSGRLAPTGAAIDGEVEDYLAAIVTGSASATLSVELPGGNMNIVVEGNSAVARKGTTLVSKVPVANFGSLKFNGSSVDDILLLTILGSLATKTLEFDGGLGKDFLTLVEAGKTLDLTDAKVTLRDIEEIDITGTGSNKLVISVDKVKSASTTTDTLEVVANSDDTITFGTGFKAETPMFINGKFTHILTETTSGGTARVEVRNDRLLTNPLTPFDADRDGKILPLDALRIINEIRRRGTGVFALPTNGSEISRLYFDVNADGRLTALDALRIINAIARILRGGGSGEGEAVVTPVDLNLFNNQPAASREPVAAVNQEIVSSKVSRTLDSPTRESTEIAMIDSVMAEFSVDNASEEESGYGLQLLSAQR